MAAAILTLQIKDCNQRVADHQAHNILEKAKTAGAKDLKACIGTQNPSTQIIETCRETVARKAGRTCQEIMGWLATELPQTFEICQSVYKRSLEEGTKAIPKL